MFYRVLSPTSSISANSRCWLWSGNRARRLIVYRSILYNLEDHLLLESLDSVHRQVPIRDGLASSYPARRGIYLVPKGFDDSAGHFLQRGSLRHLCGRDGCEASSIPGDMPITDSTWHYTWWRLLLGILYRATKKRYPSRDTRAFEECRWWGWLAERVWFISFNAHIGHTGKQMNGIRLWIHPRWLSELLKMLMRSRAKA